MEDEKGWREVKGPGLPPGSEVNEITGDFRTPYDEPPEGDGPAGDREPRNPKIPPAAGAVAIELSETVQE